MLVDHDLIEVLAMRIENAYRLRRRDWDAGCSTSRVWSAAALRLVNAQREAPWLPLDPELFVAAQPLNQPFVNPWCALTHGVRRPGATDAGSDRSSAARPQS